MTSFSNPSQAFTDKSKIMSNQDSGFMNKLKQLVLPSLAIIVIGFAAQTFFPWWSIAIVAFLVGIYFANSWGLSFVYGLVGVTILWCAYAGFLDSANGGAMSSSISGLFGGVVKGTQLMYVTCVLGGLVGGFAAATGTSLRQLIK